MARCECGPALPAAVVVECMWTHDAARAAQRRVREPARAPMRTRLGSAGRGQRAAARSVADASRPTDRDGAGALPQWQRPRHLAVTVSGCNIDTLMAASTANNSAGRQPLVERSWRRVRTTRPIPVRGNDRNGTSGDPCPTAPRMRGRPKPGGPGQAVGMGPLDHSGEAGELPCRNLRDDRRFTVERVEPGQRLSLRHRKGRAGDASQHAVTSAERSPRGRMRSFSGSTVIPALRSRDVGDGCGVRRSVAAHRCRPSARPDVCR